MIRIFKKVQFSKEENRMKSIANTQIARDFYFSSKSTNLKFLLNERLTG